jgi:rhodanese-related sulfurtransferase
VRRSFEVLPGPEVRSRVASERCSHRRPQWGRLSSGRPRHVNVCTIAITVLDRLAYGSPVAAQRGIEAELEAARALLHRVTPEQTKALLDAGGLVVDTRTETQRRRAGQIPGAVVIDRTVLEWRLDPGCPFRSEVARGYDDPVVVVCAEGYSSSLAAASLQRMGLSRATDMVGGFEAWVAAGLPVDPPVDPPVHPPSSDVATT